MSLDPPNSVPDRPKWMGTKTPAVARLESGGGSQRHSPSIATLCRYAEAVGCRLEIRLRSARKSSTVA